LRYRKKTRGAQSAGERGEREQPVIVRVKLGGGGGKEERKVWKTGGGRANPPDNYQRGGGDNAHGKNEMEKRSEFTMKPEWEGGKV